ncbi:MAG: DUF4143 domain-containing protein, partial [Elusimicrobia bacterium]|nr:DUF4143 domain-containing protein [Elusimicrobiota bacterium]
MGAAPVRQDVADQAAGLRGERDLRTHPRLGLSWEGFAIEEVIRCLDADRDAYFYKTHGGAELDLLIARGGRRYG